MDTFLRTRSRPVCLVSALVISLILIIHGLRSPLAPAADGAGYATRAFALYGFLHTGQWGHFFELFCWPRQSVCAPHQLLFFLLPKALAGLKSYFILQVLTTYLFLAVAVCELAEALNRLQWAPFIFLLCAVNTVALTDFYTFYLDMPFFALGLWVMARQVKAWQRHDRTASLIAGAGLGALFLIKPANALIFLGTYFLSEFFHAGFVLATQPSENKPSRALGGHWLWTIAGFLPVGLLAWVVGAGQSILLLIDQNEVEQTVTPLACTGLLRFFYFPLCLSAYYHAVLLGLLLLGAFVAGKWLAEKKEGDAVAFPLGFYAPLFIAFVIFGEFFSFWMLDKPMRSLLLILPILWIWIGRIWEKQRARPSWLFVVAIVYALLAFSQKASDVFKSKGELLEDTYQLSASSWGEFPAAWRKGISLNQYICTLVSARLPPHQVICINSIELRKSLAWRLENQDLLDGRPPAYEVRNLFDYLGDYYPQSLVGADRLVLITFYPAPPLKIVWLETSEFMDHASAKWNLPGVGQMTMFPLIQNQPIGYDIRFDHPLTASQVNDANTTTFGNLKRAKGDEIETVAGHHYSAAEAWALIRAWRNERLQ